MLKAQCKHCQREITYEQGDNGVWFEPTLEVQRGAQYCWMDPVAGSRLHEPNPDTIKEQGRPWRVGGRHQGVSTNPPTPSPSVGQREQESTGGER